MIIKRSSKCRFCDKCYGCLSLNSCISASGITQDLRRYFLGLKGYRQKATPQMIKGKQRHIEYLKDYKTLSEYGYSQFKRDFFKGKLINLSEIAVCSPRGFHGIIDLFTIQYRKDNSIHIKVIELKSIFMKRYYKQISIYCSILSDPNAMISYETRTKRTRKKKRIAHPLFPKKDFNLNIDLELRFFGQKRHFKQKWMTNSTLTEFAQGVMLHLEKERKKRLRYHKHGIFYLEKIPPCKFCPQNIEKCSLYEICKKVNFVKEKKTKFTYFGKKQLLVSSKPIIRR